MYGDISDFAKVRGDEETMQRVVAALKSVEEGKDIEERTVQGHSSAEQV